MISLIIPVRVSEIVYDAVPRIRSILSSAPPSHYEVVIVDYGSPAAEAENVSNACKEFHHAKLIRVDNEQDPFSAGHARNIGAQHATHDIIMFNDIDCLCSTEMYVKISDEANIRNLAENAYDFFSLPIAFLTFEGTQEYNRLITSQNEFNSDDIFYKNIIRSNKHLVQFMAYTGSTIVVNRLHFLALGGTSREFHGHGGEDYDIKHRLAAYNPIGQRPLDYYLNTKDNQTNQYVGFRAYFALYGIEALYSGLYMVHLWHPKREPKNSQPVNRPSYNQTERNFALLKSLMKRFDETGEQPSPLPILNSPERTLILCRPNSIALESMRHALPLTGDYRVIDENAFRDANSLLRALTDGGFTCVGFLNPYGNEHRLALYEAVRRAGHKFWVFDRGSLPNSWFFDPGGFNADSSSYHPENWDKKLTPEEKESVRSYIRNLRQGSQTLEKNGELKSKDYWHAKLGIGHRKVLFVPLQRPSDTVTRYFNRQVGTYENFHLWVSSIAANLDPAEWVVVCKKHPLETIRPGITNVIFAPDDAHVHDLLELCDASLLLNSGVGVLSLIFGKPVIACGDSFYAHPGLAMTADTPDQASSLIRNAHIDSEVVERFIYHLVHKVYSFGQTIYSERKQPDGSMFTAATQIKFERIRGLGREAILGHPREPARMDSILFSSFGGSGAIDRARQSPHLKKDQSTGLRKSIAASHDPFQQACTNYHAGMYTEAATLFHQAHMENSANINALRCEAEALLAAGRRNEALEKLRTAKTKLPKNKRLGRRYATIRMPWLRLALGDQPFEVPKYN